MSKIKLAIMLIAGLGFLNAVYLLIIKLTQEPALCIQGVGDCWSVNTSRYSEIYGVPVSLLGALAFLCILFFQWLDVRFNSLNKYTSFIIFGLSLTGTIYSAFLTYIEIWVIRAICPFCVLSAFLMVLILGLSILKLGK
jgi:uncharacterized membrane protein